MLGELYRCASGALYIGGTVGLKSNRYVLNTCAHVRPRASARARARAHANPSHNTLKGALARARAGAPTPYPSKPRFCVP